MAGHILVRYTLCTLMVITGSLKAQKNIEISDSLAANAEKMNVKLGSQGVGKLWKLRFGDYGVVTSKAGWLKETIKSNLFNTKIESKSTEKFFFLLADKSGDSAWVNAANNIMVHALQEIELFPNFSWGSNELLQETHNFSAFIIFNRDTSDTWALLMNTTRGSDIENKEEAFLTNGNRKIMIYPAGAKKKSNNMFGLSPAGYEFKENGSSLSAVQYFSGMGPGSEIVWLKNAIDPRMKMILSAAMTAILQLKMAELQNQEQH